MSVRALAALAAFLLVLCVAAGALLVHRLGWWHPAEPIEFVFVNPLLTVARGQRVVLRPILEGVPSLRYTFLATMLEPESDDAMSPVPHLRAGIEERESDDWYYKPPPAAITLCQMGALTSQEWLEEIRPVRQVGGSTEERMLLKATFGHRNGAMVGYYHDPGQPVPAFGWTRNEMISPGGLPEVHFATDGGIAEVPPPPQENR